MKASKRSFSFSHDLEGLVALREHVLKKTGVSSLEGVTVNMEPTSGVWEVTANFLRVEGAKVFFTPPGVVSSQRKANSRYAKTDRIDARTLAAIPDTLPERMVRVTRTEGRIRSLRSLISQRERLLKEATSWKNRLTAELELVWRPLLVEIDGQRQLSQLGRCFFKRFGEPAQVRKLGHTRFVAWCKKHAHGSTNPDLFETFWQGSLRLQRC